MLIKNHHYGKIYVGGICMNEKFQIVKFVDNEFELDVRTDKENETVWLTQDEMALLFDVDRTRIVRHINNIYKDDDIQSLSPRDFTRLRPGVYCGSTEYSTQLLIEIVSNAIDEWSVGHGDTINVDYKDDGSCRVEDFAQGFPVNVVREDGETVLQASFDVLNTSGKFSEDGVYEGTALGLNGIGSKLTNFLSKMLSVQTVRDGKFECIHFVDGIFTSEKTGFNKPDKRIFQAALKALGVENTKRVLVIGDNLNSDIKGGINAGLDTCWVNFNNQENNTNISPTHIARDFEELKYIILGDKYVAKDK